MAPQPKDPITDYSQTQRILLLIDLNPLLHISNPTPFLDSLLSSTKTLLSFPPLSSSLFSFKTFFSSLSPLLSSSKLHPFLPSSSLSLSFNHSSFTLISLSETLQSFHNQQAFDSSPTSPSRASCLAASMRQLVHDYAWDPVVDDSITGTLFHCSQNDSVVVGSNLVILLSPACRSKKGLSEFLNVEIDDERLQNVDVFCEKFRGIFDNVNSAFVKRGIQFSWIDVRYELEDGDCKVQFDDFQLKSGFLSAIRSLGWGFCTTDSIILGSALVPFGLIYPKIAISSKFFNYNDCRRKLQAQLVLEILDASTKPLECKCSDLEMVHLKMLARNKCNDFLFAPESQPQGCERKNLFFGLFGDGIVKLHIKAVQRHKECANFVGHLSDPILVHESLGHSKRNLKECSGGFFADRVLDMLAMELGEYVQRKSIPIWQILLSFLYREDCWAVVSLSNGNGDSHLGVLKPFTFSSALLSIIEDGVYPPNMVHDFGGAEVARFITKMNSEIHKSYVGKSINSQDGPLPNKTTTLGDGKKKKKKLRMLQDLTWSAFCKKAVELLELDLGEVYFARECNNSKKLKFLKCWMKQIKKPRCSSLTLQPKHMSQQEIQKENDDRLTKLHQEIEQPVSSSASAGEKFLTEASKIQDEATLDFRLETCEAFFSNLSSKIQQGLESEGVDLGALAERLVNSSIYWLYQKRGMKSPSESQNLEVKSDDACGSIVLELTKVLLREPKELAAKHKDNIPSFQASDPGCTGFASKDVVREYEMQILFRMEILQSELGASIGEPMKQKFVKQICLLLESIQCHLEGGFFGDWSLDNYVGKIIRSRYCHTLGDIVHKIYTKMDLLLFVDEDESPNTLLNSEDSNQSWREKLERDEFGENKRNNEPVSVEAESLQLPENDDGSPQGIIKQTEHACRLMKAQERRERARRFASFTSWMPDLQRVWAPKQPKLTKQKSYPLRKLSKRKERRRVSNDMVFETPMTGNKRSCPRGNSFDDEDHQDSGSQSGGSVSKALFQDDS
ncbi:hypothetical protein I3843_06G005600 [Carya illinoinensis]|nr:hypothetical protein I3843_06G005600 [Carya illinoinensis]